MGRDRKTRNTRVDRTSRPKLKGNLKSVAFSASKKTPSFGEVFQDPPDGWGSAVNNFWGAGVNEAWI